MVRDIEKSASLPLHKLLAFVNPLYPWKRSNLKQRTNNSRGLEPVRCQCLHGAVERGYA